MGLGQVWGYGSGVEGLVSGTICMVGACPLLICVAYVAF